MAKYLVLWKVEEDKLPADPTEKKKMLLEAVAMVKQQLKEGLVKDWGQCIGESGGYNIVEAKPEEMHSLNASWMPLVKYTVRPVLTIAEAEKAYKALPG